MSMICGFEAEIEGKRIFGRVLPKDKAFNKYDDAIAESNTSLIVEEEKQDVFSTLLGNIPPRATVTITITFVSELALQGANS